MHRLDMATVLLSYVLSSAICTGIMASLWRMNRRRYSGLGLWLTDYVLQLLAVLLVALRGPIPPGVSIALGTPLAVAGAVLLYRGLGFYSGTATRDRLTLCLLGAFVIAHLHFAFVQPSLASRNLCFAIALAAVCGQCAWLLLREVGPDMRGDTRGAGLVMVAYVGVNAARIPLTLIFPPGPDLFTAAAHEVTVIVAYQMLFIALTLTLSLAVNARLNRSLVRDIERCTEVERALRESEERFALAFRMSPHAMMLTRMRDAHIVEANPAFYSLTGYASEEVADRTSLEIALWHDPAARREVVARVRARERVVGLEAAFRTRDGRLIRGLYSAEVIVLGGEPHVLSSIADITRIKQAEETLRDLNKALEDRVKERTKALEASVAELESFSYTVSHDLRSPIRAMNGFSQVLVDEFGEALGEEGRSLCGRIGEAARNMGLLIDGLLAFTRFGRRPLELSDTDMAALAAEAYKDGANEEMRARIALTMDDLPPARCDASAIRLVWTHLLDNAVKFVGPTPNPEIHIGSRPDGSRIAYYVRDNGVGFDMKYADRLFELFWRVHPPAEYEGKGIGLAVVRRIIERHEGRVWAESEEGKGTTIHFTLAPALAGRPT